MPPPLCGHGRTKPCGRPGMTVARRLLSLHVVIGLVIWPSIGNDAIISETDDTVHQHSVDPSASSSSSTLYCYQCDYEMLGETCKTINTSSPTILSTACVTDHFCQVWHFYSESENGRTYYFKRGCASTCYPGCTPLDDMENRFVSCTSCCQTHYCNLDNAAVTTAAVTTTTSKLVSALGTLVVLFMADV